MLQQRLTRNLYTGQTEPLTAPLSFDFTEDLGDKRNLSLLSQYGGAAAAYSLRALGSYNENVVRVRRASDNDEKDFTASQISSGEMVNWVNSQTVPPLDIGVETSEGRIPVPEGGTSIGTPAAAYSLRNLSTTYTGNVVDVRRSSDGTEESFTAEEVSDGTLEAWVTETVDLTVMDFDGVNDHVVINQIDYAGDFDISFKVLFQAVGGRQGFIGHDTNNYIRILNNGGLLQIKIAGSSFFPSSGQLTQGQLHTVRVARIGSTLTYYLDGDSIQSTSSLTGTFPVSFIGQSFAATEPAKGIIFDVDLGAASYQGYGNTNADWEDQIGSNDGTVNGSPTTTTIQVQGDAGTVSKWYDQSGNDNHAVQTAPANQPTIVEGGSLVTGGIDFDGVNDVLTTVSGVLSGETFLVSSVQSLASTSGSGSMALWAQYSTGTAGRTFLFADKTANDYEFFSQGTNGIVLNSTPLSTDKKLLTVNSDGTNASLFRDGALSDTDSSVEVSVQNIGFSIGAASDGTFSYGGSIEEIIVYDSDQSDNRTAIEANIGETYGITGIPAYDNTVDGFVETWYDQSGNGNHATQSVAGSQPKIVDGGSLVAGGIDFDGVNDLLEVLDPMTNAQGLSLFLVANIDDGQSVSVIVRHGQANPENAWNFQIATDSGNPLGIVRCSTGTISTSTTEKYITAGGSVDNFGALSLYGLNLQDGVGREIFVNGSSLSLTRPFGSDQSSTFNSTEVLSIGANSDTSQPIQMAARELIIYDSDQSANRTDIEGNINAHYNIYP
jgi:hypothetical protein